MSTEQDYHWTTRRHVVCDRYLFSEKGRAWGRQTPGTALRHQTVLGVWEEGSLFFSEFTSSSSSSSSFFLGGGGGRTGLAVFCVGEGGAIIT